MGVVVVWVGGSLGDASQVFEAPVDRLGRVARGVGMMEVGRAVPGLLFEGWGRARRLDASVMGPGW